MARQTLPKEFVEELNNHPCVEQATEWTIRFTPEFKQKAYDEYIHGKSMRKIFTENGFDVEKIGKKRIENFRNKLIEKSACDSGFTDKRTDKSLQNPPSTEAQLMKKIRDLEHRVTYLEQENSFLKKIQEQEKGCVRQAGKRK